MYDLENAVYVAGIAKTGKEDSISAMYQNLSLGLVVDRTTGQILDLGCSMVMEETVYSSANSWWGKDWWRTLRKW